MKVRSRSKGRRRGATLIMTALLLTLFLAMVAFAVDLGQLGYVRTQLQKAADSTALASTGYLVDSTAATVPPPTGYSGGGWTASATGVAVAFAKENKAGGVNLDLPVGDVTVGRLDTTTWPVSVVPAAAGQQPNAVSVTLRRDDVANGPVSLAFAAVFGQRNKSLSATATAFADDGIQGFKIISDGSTPNPKLMPIVVRATDWDAALSGGPDAYSHDAVAKTVGAGSDGVREIKLIPFLTGNGSTTPGNCGTLAIGSPNNTNDDLARQITQGPNGTDFSYFTNNTLSFGGGTSVTVNGDWGVSAGVESALQSVIGQPRILALYDNEHVSGSITQFRIVRWVGAVVVSVNLQGPPSLRSVMVQPCLVIDPTAIGGGVNNTTSQSLFRPVTLIE